MDVSNEIYIQIMTFGFIAPELIRKEEKCTTCIDFIPLSQIFNMPIVLFLKSESIGLSLGVRLR